MQLDMSPYLRQNFVMPSEAAPHDACWISWPSREDLWGRRLSQVRREHELVARTISRFEAVFVVCRPEHAAEVLHRCGPDVQVWCAPIDDSWMRDSGPTFVVGDRGGLAVANWGFNAWGEKYRPFAADAALKRTVAEALRLPLVTTRLIAEGGALLSDGEGTILTTESCLLNPNRNPGLTRAEVEQELLVVLGAQRVVWLPGDSGEVETDGHVDCLASIVAPGRIIVEDPSTAVGRRREVLEENRRALRLARDARGRSFEIIDLPAAPRIDAADERHQPSYVNFYIANGAVIMPGHGIPADDEARAVVAAAFPDREVIQLQLRALPYGGGNIHCITQQQPSRLAGLLPLVSHRQG
jgi:agmatine deiminase